MNEQPRNLSKAESDLQSLFALTRTTLPGGPAALVHRELAFTEFLATGLPHRRVEAWKYTDLRRLMREAAPAAGEGETQEISAALNNDPLSAVDRARIVVANGRYRPELSDTDGLVGVRIENLTDVLEGQPDWIGSPASGGDAVVALNAALAQGGVVVTVAANANPGRALEIAHVTTADGPAAVTTRDSVILGENSSLQLIESHRGPDGLAYQVNALADVKLGTGARLAWTRLQAEGSDAQHLASFFAHLGRDCTLDHLAVNSGGALWRWQGETLVAGEGTQASFSGVTMLAGTDHGDTRLTVTHAAGHSNSRELFKSIVDDRSQGAFQGLIVVKPDAQKTDARMMTQALLLSPEAQFAAKPELEIFADDVQCGHGATSGQIDESQLFYLMARGIPRAVAVRILIEAFLDDPIDSLKDGALAGALRRVVSTWLTRRENGVAS